MADESPAWEEDCYRYPLPSTTITLGEACGVGLQGPALLNPVKRNWNVRARNMEDSTIDD